MTEGRQDQRWVEQLSDEDLMFLKRFVLASGSLKALAKAYGISYPTVRLRLDRLIQKIEILDDHAISGDFERTLRLLYADGKIDMVTLKTMLRAHQEEMEVRDETDSDHRRSADDR
jgi:hypothetical protein